MLFLCIAFVILGIYVQVSTQITLLAVLCFVAAAICGACFLVKKLLHVVWLIVRKPLAVVAGILALCMLVTLIPISFGVKSQPDADCNYLIVLGCKVQDGVASPVLQDRIDAAYDYLIAHESTVCIPSGGTGDDESISEARCIADALIARGIAPERILPEEQATSTSENLAYAMALIDARQDEGAITVGILSSEFHLFRASRMARAYDTDTVYIAAHTSDTGKRIGYTVREIFALWKFLLTGE